MATKTAGRTTTGRTKRTTGGANLSTAAPAAKGKAGGKAAAGRGKAK